ncbi:VOC family protein [Steroidobacter cummioxidans]|uniref:VOC family protein n=1 Tax=Steroidobacter cummioxidans TaxID=1803913 RepID=UPI000E30F52F|nr:VOC family protein [Steroidobacter cummioxidans]
MSDAPDYQLDHVCLAVRKIAPARAVLEKMLGYTARTEVVTNTRQQVNVQFMRKAGSIDIKLIEPSSLSSPLVEFIKERGGGLHHLAFKTQQVAAGVQDLQAKGARVLAAPQPGEAFDEADIAFAFLGAGLNVELIDTDRRRLEKE